MLGGKIKNDGFTLMEVMIALTVFSVGLLALANMQITGIEGNSTAQSVTAKVAAGTGIISQILALSGNSAEGLDTDSDGTVDFGNFLETNITNASWTLADPIDQQDSWTVAIDVDKAPPISYVDENGNNKIWDDDVNDLDLKLTQINVRIYNSAGHKLLERIIMKRRY